LDGNRIERAKHPAIQPLANAAAAVSQAWRRFWLAPEDPIKVCLLRWLAGGMILYTHLVWSIDLADFFSSTGWQSAELVRELQRDEWAASLWWLVGDSQLWLFHLSCVAVLLMFWIGLFTRATSILTYLIVVSYANRAPLAMFGLDQINTLLALYLCLGPCGAVLSVDSWRRRRRAKRQPAKRQPAKRLRPLRPSPFARLSARLIQCHLCIIYFWAGIAKLQGESWWSGAALWRVASNFEYQQADLTWIVHVPWLFQAVTLATWAWEVSFPFLVWRPWLRPWMLLVGAGMHLGIGLFCGMWTFGLVMIFTYVAFLKPRHVHWVLQRAGIHPGGPSPQRDRRPRGLRPLPASPPQGPLPEPSPDPNNDEQVLEPVSLVSGSGGLLRPPAPAGRQALVDPPGPGVVMPDLPRADDLVVFLDSSARRRCAMIAKLDRVGFRCLGVDAWPETIHICRALRPRAVLFTVGLPASELYHWVRLVEDACPRLILIGLAEHPHRFKQHDRSSPHWIKLPAKLETILAVLHPEECLGEPRDVDDSLPSEDARQQPMFPHGVKPR
jgi:hypothetical protein